MKLSVFSACAALIVAVAGPASAATVVLGSYNFDSTKFGDTLIQSDGGTFAATNWLNVTNNIPGSPGYLTGANFDTGIANIGLNGALSYTIGYGSGILNGTGADLGIVTARFSSDPITIAFSTDGTSFGAAQTLASSAAVASGVSKNYYYNGGGTYGASLFVTSINLSDFGIANGTSILAARVTGTTELDLIRVAGFASNTPAVPEPATWAMMIGGFGMIGGAMRRQRATRVSFA